MKSAPRSRKNGKAPRRSRIVGHGIGVPRATGLNGGFPEQIRTTLRYADMIPLIATTTATGVLYGGNCLWDPYLAVGGHQPSNFDNWTRIYGFYTVVGVTARLRYLVNTTSSAQPAAFGLSLSYDGSLVSTYPSVTSLIEQPHTVFGRATAGIVNGSFIPPISITQEIGEWFGAKADEVLSQATYRGTSSTNPPSIGPYLEVWQASLTGAATGANTYLLEIEYDTVWSNPLPSLPS